MITVGVIILRRSVLSSLLFTPLAARLGVEFDDLGEVVALSPLGVDQNGLSVLSEVLEANLLNFLHLDYLLELKKIIRVFVEVTIV
jgi:hypothetical protein